VVGHRVDEYLERQPVFQRADRRQVAARAVAADGHEPVQ